MGKATQRSFVIRIVKPERADKVVTFQGQHFSKYLWPRELKDYERMAEERCLFEVVETTSGKAEIVGTCYIRRDPPSSQDSEFGGVCLIIACQNMGIARPLGVVAISHLYVWGSPSSRLIAHVHADNEEPRFLLTKKLGFSFVSRDTYRPADIPNIPKDMLNEKGELVGDLFEFKEQTLLEFADWFEKFDGTCRGSLQNQPAWVT